MMIEILIIIHGMIQAIMSIIGKCFVKWTGLETWRYNGNSLMVDFLGIVSWPPSCGDSEIGGESSQIVVGLGSPCFLLGLHGEPTAPHRSLQPSIITIVYD
jgi:hypothetical protein